MRYGIHKSPEKSWLLAVKRCLEFPLRLPIGFRNGGEMKEQRPVGEIRTRHHVLNTVEDNGPLRIEELLLFSALHRLAHGHAICLCLHAAFPP
jgi:hypothetical protein